MASAPAPEGCIRREPSHERQATVLHVRHRGGIPPRRPGEPRVCRGAGRADEGVREGARQAGGAGVLPLADRDRHQRPQGLQGRAQGAGRAAPHHRRRCPKIRHRPHRRLDPSVRRPLDPRDDAEGALPGSGRRLCRHRAAPRHLRHARARRHRRRRAAHRSDEPGALFPAAPADAVDVLAVLAGRGHRPQELPARRLPRAAAHRPAAALRELRRVPAHGRRAGAQQGDRGRHQDLVGPAPLGQVSDAGDARHGCVHAHRRRGLHRGALRLHAAHAVAAAHVEPEVALLSLVPDRGEPLARAALRRARDAVRFRQGQARARSPR